MDEKINCRISLGARKMKEVEGDEVLLLTFGIGRLLVGVKYRLLRQRLQNKMDFCADPYSTLPLVLNTLPLLRL